MKSEAHIIYWCLSKWFYFIQGSCNVYDKWSYHKSVEKQYTYALWHLGLSDNFHMLTTFIKNQLFGAKSTSLLVCTDSPINQLNYIRKKSLELRLRSSSFLQEVSSLRHSDTVIYENSYLMLTTLQGTDCLVCYMGAIRTISLTCAVKQTGTVIHQGLRLMTEQ